MNPATATISAPPPPHASPQTDYVGALKTALAMFGDPATEDRSMVRASCFVACLAGALRGAGDEALGAAIYAIVQPPQSAAAGAA